MNQHQISSQSRHHYNNTNSAVAKSKISKPNAHHHSDAASKNADHKHSRAAANDKFNEYLLSHFMKDIYKPQSNSWAENISNDMLINEYAAALTRGKNGIKLIELDKSNIKKYQHNQKIIDGKDK